ncbi:MAG: ligase-associated DNA damage response endonuclease PdeM [Bacteroidota bacterium]
METQKLQINEQHFVLHPSGGLLWEERKALLISDVHLGKISHFRKFGSAVPREAIQHNFEGLSQCIAYFKPDTLVFLGDLFHSHLNQEWLLFQKWVQGISQDIILVSGNHDIISPLNYEALDISVVSELQWDGFLLTHHPEIREGVFNFSGHLHPAVRLRGPGRQSLRLPCFHKGDSQMVLPAFGTFTGTHCIDPGPKDQVFAIADSSIIKI